MKTQSFENSKKSVFGRIFEAHMGMSTEFAAHAPLVPNNIKQVRIFQIVHSLDLILK